MKTRLEIARPSGFPKSKRSFFAVRSCDTNSDGRKFLCRPCVPVWQKVHENVQPTCEEMHSVPREVSGIYTAEKDPNNRQYSVRPRRRARLNTEIRTFDLTSLEIYQQFARAIGGNCVGSCSAPIDDKMLIKLILQIFTNISHLMKRLTTYTSCQDE